MPIAYRRIIETLPLGYQPFIPSSPTNVNLNTIPPTYPGTGINKVPSRRRGFPLLNDDYYYSSR